MPKLWFVVICTVITALAWPVPARAVDRPNIVLIYADDLGYGDVGCQGATRVATPNVDRLANQGLRFTDAHSAAATCTPSRYALLTGQYAWRKKGTNVLPGSAALIIPPTQLTLPTLLRQAGYRTGVVGKWHLGLGHGNLDWNQPIRPGPLEVGFDTCFIIPATGDRVPCVYVEDHHVVGLDPNDPIRVSYGKPIGDDPTGLAHPEQLELQPSHGHDQTIVNRISRIGYMSGGNAARWVDRDMADRLASKAVEFMRGNPKGKPFFLFLALHDIHVPRTPHPRFARNTTMGPRGDAIAQLDATTGLILNTLDDLGLTNNTLVIFTSDNGPVLDDGYKDDAVAKQNGHRPAGPLRGGKYSAFEAGTRVPFILRWPARVKPGVSDALVGQIDLIASFASLVGIPLKNGDAPDSTNILQALIGESATGRDHLVEQADVLSLRKGTWKLIPSQDGPALLTHTNTETGLSPHPQLFNLAEDIGEQTNLASRDPQKMAQMYELLEKIRHAEPMQGEAR